MKNENDKPEWTVPQACGILNLNQSQLQKWLRIGYIKPASPAPAKGRPNHFSFDDLVRLSVLKILGERRMLGTERAEVAGYLVGEIDVSRIKTLRMGPESEGTAWGLKGENSPVDDEPYVISINLDLIRRTIRQAIS